MSSTFDSFPDRLSEAVRRCNTPLIVGIDPRFDQLPQAMVDSSRAHDWKFQARAFSDFSREVIDVVSGLVAAVKIQAAFFEALGPDGMNSLGEVIDHASDAGLIVILDGKRNDIGSTAEAYASAWLGRRPHSPWNCDALTVNPYMGDDSLAPFQQRATETGCGIFVLVRTSNPGSSLLQQLPCGEQKLYLHVAQWVESAASDTLGKCGYGAVGAVVGGTHPHDLAELREVMPHTLFLVPGYGAQGASARDLAGAFDRHGRGAVINSSRNIIFAYRSSRYATVGRWQEAVDRATRDAIKDLNSATGN